MTRPGLAPQAVLLPPALRSVSTSNDFDLSDWLRVKLRNCGHLHDRSGLESRILQIDCSSRVTLSRRGEHACGLREFFLQTRSNRCAIASLEQTPE